MANAYYDYNNGLAGNDGLTPSTPKATRSQAVAVAGAGDKVIALDGTHVHESGHFVFDDDRIESGNTYRGATLNPAAGETVYCARTSATLAEANNPFRIEALVFDGLDQVTYGLRLAEQSAAESVITQLHNIEINNCTVYNLLISEQGGRQEIVNLKLGGLLTSRAIGATGNLSAKANQVIDIQGCELALDEVTGSKKAIELSQVGTPTNTLDLYFKGLTGTISIAASASMTLLDVSTKDDCTVTGFDLVFNADDATTNVSGIIMTGNASTYELPNGLITNCKIKFNAPAGFAIAFGNSTTDSHITGGLVASNHVTGKHYASNTPHNYVMGQGTAGELKGNASQDGYVGYLLSITDTCDASANIAFDCYGPSYYAKGTTAATIKDNIAICSGKFTQRDRGILAVAPQGATNTTAVTFQENLIIVANISKIHSLAYIEDVNQVCTFTRNTYIIPDTVDVTTENLFSYENGVGGAANNTLDQWNAQTEVTDDVIVQMPAAEIAAIVKQYKESISPTPKLMLMPSGAVESTIGGKVLV